MFLRVDENELIIEENLKKQYPLALYNLILLPINKQSIDEKFAKKLQDFVAKLQITEMDLWRLYKITRTALRYGHWNTVALPLLMKIKKQVNFSNILKQSCIFFSVKV